MSIKRLFAASFLAISTTSQAGVITGGSTLLDNSSLSQLEAWVGQGDLTLTNIFTKTAGSTAEDFHRAADNKGPTFVVMRATEDGVNWRTIGGYNPMFWETPPPWQVGYHWSWGEAYQTAFIFNLTDSIKRSQTGIAQTFNSDNLGPSFGLKHDLEVDFSLSLGTSGGDSYGGPSDYFKSLVDGSENDGYNMQIGEFEVFTVSSAELPIHKVPEPAMTALLSVGMLGMAAVRRKKGKSA